MIQKLTERWGGGLKNYISALLGTSLEYYDYSLFLFLAPVTSHIFFSSNDPTSALILTYGISFLGTLFRPLGAFVFGYIGDRWGRKVALSNSITMMSLASLLMAVMPTYSQVGLFAPILVMICRIMQSMSAGGELNGSAIFVIEHAGPKRAGLAGGLVTAFTAFGFILSSLAAYVCSLEFMPEYSWRIAFGVGALAGLIAYFIRTYASETEEFEHYVSRKSERDNQPRLQRKVNWLDYLPKCIFTFFITGAFTSMYYFSIVFMGSYMPLVRNIEYAHTSGYVPKLLVLYMLSLLASGLLSDKYTQRKVMFNAGLFFLCLSIPCTYMICYSSLTMALMGQSLLVFAAGLFNGSLHSMLNAIFPVQHRYKMISVFYSLGSALLGSVTPVLCFKLWHITHIPLIPVVWVLCTVSMGIFAVMFVPLVNSDTPVARLREKTLG